MTEELGLTVSWFALPHRKPGTQHEAADQSRGARHRRYRKENRERDRNRYLQSEFAADDCAQAVASLIDRYSITIEEDGSTDGIAAAAYLGGPVFRLGEEVFVGRQHLPLIRARL